MEVQTLIQIGESLGLKDQDLKDFIKEEQAKERDRRAEERERLREEKELAQLKLQIENVKLTQQNNNGIVNNQGNVRSPKLPVFVCGKDKLDVYLHRFERYARAQNWDEEFWAINLSALLSGKALETYSRLNDEDSQNYEVVKEALLQRYALTSEGFRKKFRSARPESGETATQFIYRLRGYVEHWIGLSGRKETFDDLMDLILMEQFMTNSSKEMETFIKERKPLTLQDFTDIADTFVESRSGWQRSGKQQTQRQNPSPRETGSSDTRTGSSGKPTGRSAGQGGCFICGKHGHIAKNCNSRKKLVAASVVEDRLERPRKTLPNQRQEGELDPYHPSSIRREVADSMPGAGSLNGQTTYTERSVVNSCVSIDDGHSQTGSESEIESIQVKNGTADVSAASTMKLPENMPVQDGIVNGIKVQVLRDSGCSTTFVRKGLVKPGQFTGEERDCHLMDWTLRRYPVAMVFIKSPFYVGELEVLCPDDPIYDVVLGNLSGVREPMDPDQGLMGDQCLAVETRSQRKKENKPIQKLKVPKQTDVASAEEFRKQQAEDPTLDSIRRQVESGDVKTSRKGNQSMFRMKQGLLYREFRPVNGEMMLQLVVPRKFRGQILQLAHESILAGHLGSHKTAERIMQNFFWAGIQADTVRFCRSCDTCQRSINKGRVSKVPLGVTPLIDEPFHRVAVDIVGPISPVTTRGCRYILTLMDYATRYPEAVPLKNIDAISVAEALFSIFTRVGFPREMLTDRGTQFMSEVMQEVNRLMSVRHLTTTPYHPACNGLIEKFNGTLKQMLKKMAEEKPTDWDRYIDALLFAYREAPHDSTGFSPFELLYGREVRGPLMILRELWANEDNTDAETKTTYQYVMDLREKLENTCKMVKEELKKSHSVYRDYYNKKAKHRSFKIGEEVLLLLPTDRNKLLMHWKGPFKVVGKVGKLDYRVDLGSRVTTFHANLLKAYYRRGNDSSNVGTPYPAVAGVSVVEDTSDVDAVLMSKTNQQLIDVPNLKSTQTVEDICIGDTLSDEQTKQLKQLLGNYSDVLTDIPSVSNLGYHGINLMDPRPIKSKPYPLPHALRKVVDDEVKEMVELGVIEPSNSPYASPVVLVKKPDGSNRFCCDYRKLNMVTIPDAEPIPDQEEIFTALAKDNYFSKLDLTKGYWQIPLAEEAKPLTAFVTHNGLYQFRTMPFGLINAPATFSRVMRNLLRGIDGVHNFIDDILIHTTSWEKHLEVLKELLSRLRKANMKAKPSKCSIAQESLDFLGHRVGGGRIQPMSNKVQAIQEAPRPETKRQLRSFLGFIGYYRKFIPSFAEVAVPLTNLTKKGKPNVLEWGESEERAFKSLKSKISNHPILHIPDVTRPFILRTDASETGLGAVLLQEFDDEKFPVAFASRKLLDRERRYSTIERECLAVVWAVQKFEAYLYGREFVLEVDHEPLRALRRGKLANGRVLRWALALQSYRYRVQAIKGRENVGADYMSRLVSG